MRVSFRQNLDLKREGFAVKKKRFAVEQIVAILKQAELGIPVAELIRQVGISEQTFYRWKKKYSGLEVDQVRQLKQMAEENSRLKRIVADLTLDKAMLQVACLLWVLVTKGILFAPGHGFIDMAPVSRMPETATASLIVSAVMILAWLLFFTKTSARTAAFSYAETLLRACDLCLTTVASLE
jgi:putative transposase